MQKFSRQLFVASLFLGFATCSFSGFNKPENRKEQLTKLYDTAMGSFVQWREAERRQKQRFICKGCVVVGHLPFFGPKFAPQEDCNRQHVRGFRDESYERFKQALQDLKNALSDEDEQIIMTKVKERKENFRALSMYRYLELPKDDTELYLQQVSNYLGHLGTRDTLARLRSDADRISQ